MGMNETSPWTLTEAFHGIFNCMINVIKGVEIIHSCPSRGCFAVLEYLFFVLCQCQWLHAHCVYAQGARRILNEYIESNKINTFSPWLRPYCRHCCATAAAAVVAIVNSLCCPPYFPFPTVFLFFSFHTLKMGHFIFNSNLLGTSFTFALAWQLIRATFIMSRLFNLTNWWLMLPPY